MTTATLSQQEAMTWLEDSPDWQEACDDWALYREYMLRRQAGQHPEVWHLRGGLDEDGWTLLWVPEDSVFWLFTDGLPATWYYTPLTWESTRWSMEEMHWDALHRWCSKLEYYWTWSRRCVTCQTCLSRADWALALVCWDGEPDQPQCFACLRAEGEQDT